MIGNSHKGETLYGWITSSSTLEWKTFGEKGTHPIYKGDVENGKPNGLGVITFPDGSKFVGEWKEGKPWNGTQYNKDRNILGKYVNGSYIPINLL